MVVGICPVRPMKKTVFLVGTLVALLIASVLPATASAGPEGTALLCSFRETQSGPFTQEYTYCHVLVQDDKICMGYEEYRTVDNDDGSTDTDVDCQREIYT